MENGQAGRRGEITFNEWKNKAMVRGANMKFHSGLPETACGYGSTLKATEDVRAYLPSVLSKIGAKTLLDAPCGDLNWISRIDLDGIDYIGIENDPDHIATAMIRKPEGWKIIEDDLFTCKIPDADVTLCRDFLQHLPNDDVETVLGRFTSKYLLATSHEVEVNRDIRERGMFRRLNLDHLLGEPQESMPDGPGRSLSLWDIK